MLAVIVDGGSVPQNSGYMVAGYIVAAVILIGYALSLYRRSRD
jgi:hypothetical protein